MTRYPITDRLRNQEHPTMTTTTTTTNPLEHLAELTGTDHRATGRIHRTDPERGTIAKVYPTPIGYVVGLRDPARPDQTAGRIDAIGPDAYAGAWSRFPEAWSVAVAYNTHRAARTAAAEAAHYHDPAIAVATARRILEAGGIDPDDHRRPWRVEVTRPTQPGRPATVTVSGPYHSATHTVTTTR